MQLASFCAPALPPRRGRTPAARAHHSSGLSGGDCIRATAGCRSLARAQLSAARPALSPCAAGGVCLRTSASRDGGCRGAGRHPPHALGLTLPAFDVAAQSSVISDAVLPSFASFCTRTLACLLILHTFLAATYTLVPIITL
eukprot:6212313-Pleurochrysis_carterae.AAC.5